jgi:hypothetical protein
MIRLGVAELRMTPWSVTSPALSVTGGATHSAVYLLRALRLARILILKTGIWSTVSQRCILVEPILIILEKKTRVITFI